ncbi:MAG: MerR family transcriptional regulator [Actinobacteria bacterium]|nr:MerR family transcriptional regulator [Actinomycetota bacterium]
MSYSVGEVAQLAGVTVRTLHHYDEVGLLSPGGRSAGGYRRYNEGDLERLERVLFYRELGFPLEEIATILQESTDPSSHLRWQHRLLRERIVRLEEMVGLIEKEMEAKQMGVSLTPEERFEIFGDFVPEDYEQEVKERWSDTDAYKQSQRRTAAYTKEDWTQLKAEGSEIEQNLAAAMKEGVAADSDRAIELAEQHRQHITRWFYECGYDMHRGLGQMYVGDPRFSAHYESIAPGLARYISEAITANAARADRK